MGKLVVFKLGDGKFEQGFSVTLQIGEDGDRPSTEITGKLPPAPEIPQHYSCWRSAYYRLGLCSRLEANAVQVTNVSVIDDCMAAVDVLCNSLNVWLHAESFRSIRETLLEKLMRSEEVRVILQTEDSLLQRLPWHLCDLFQRYPHAEIALSAPAYERVKQASPAKAHVRILAILGNSAGIDTQADRAMLEKLPNAKIKFLVEPKRQELTNQLWSQGWDILFFAGHSATQTIPRQRLRSPDQEIGHIWINQTDSLTINDLKYALQTAVEHGLKLAIFNSCDGLGLAQELADLHIPQIIVMREPVPDQVAQEFLKYFLAGFAGGESLYQAVRQARERLEGIEDKFPCATWLPMICQNLAQMPLTWEELKQTQKKNIFLSLPPSFKCGLKMALFSSLAMSALVGGLRLTGVLQSVELQAFDQMMRSRPAEEPDHRILLVTIDDADLANQRRNGESLKGTSISEKSLNQLLVKLKQYQPRAIGLDIYRDFPAEQRDLITRFQQTDNLIGVCKGSDATETIKGGDATGTTKGLKPPPEIPKDRLGFSDFIHDNDGVVRRHLMFMNQETASLCPASYALSMQLAFRYLLPSGIQPKFNRQKNLQLGNTVFPVLKSRTGGYQGIDPNGQILLNYRSSKQIAEQVTLTQLLSSPINARAIKNRIVLIGVVAKGDFPDYWATPYGSILDEQMPGVLVQAHMISQILSAVLDGRPLLRAWSPGIEVIWIWGWAMVGGVLAWRWHSLLRLALVAGISVGMLYLVCFNLLIWGVWVPFVPSTLVLVLTVGVTSTAKKIKALKRR